MSYSVMTSRCILCSQDMGDTSHEAFWMASAEVNGNDNTYMYVKFDSSKKFLICKKCLIRIFIEKNYPEIVVGDAVIPFLKFYKVGGEVFLGYNPKKLIKKDTAQKDIEDIIIDVTKNVLMGRK